jgi:heptosyltransferase-1
MKRVLIVRLSALGDIVNSAIVVQLIHRHLKGIQVDWLCEDAFKPIAKSIIGINKVHSISLKKLKKNKSFNELFKTIRYLKHLPEYDYIIDMQGLIKSAIVSRLVGKNIYGYDKNSTRESLASFFYKHTYTKAYNDNVVERNIFLASSALDFTCNDYTDKEKIFTCKDISYENKTILLVIGASWESKKYDLDKFCELVNMFKEYTFLIASGNDIEYKEALHVQNNSHATALKPTNLNELIDIVSNVDVVIGNDTGPTHIAWAQNVASITIFGPTNERMIAQSKKNLFVKSSSSVDINNIDRSDMSIKEIPVEKIAEKLRELI